jgi:hypothetical protein
MLSAFSTFQAATQPSILDELGDLFVYGTLHGFSNLE